MSIANWDKLEIDSKVCLKSLEYLKENKIQRALNETIEFYKTNFRLKALKEIDVLLLDFKDLRNRRKKEHNFNASESKAKIVFLLESWLKQYGQEEIARNEIQDMS